MGCFDESAAMTPCYPLPIISGAPPQRVCRWGNPRIAMKFQRGFGIYNGGELPKSCIGPVKGRPCIPVPCGGAEQQWPHALVSPLLSPELGHSWLLLQSFPAVRDSIFTSLPGLQFSAKASIPYSRSRLFARIGISFQGEEWPSGVDFPQNCAWAAAASSPTSDWQIMLLSHKSPSAFVASPDLLVTPSRPALWSVSRRSSKAKTQARGECHCIRPHFQRRTPARRRTLIHGPWPRGAGPQKWLFGDFWIMATGAPRKIYAQSSLLV
jgi:hypothetical protein